MLPLPCNVVIAQCFFTKYAWSGKFVQKGPSFFGSFFISSFGQALQAIAPPAPLVALPAFLARDRLFAQELTESRCKLRDKP